MRERQSASNQFEFAETILNLLYSVQHSGRIGIENVARIFELFSVIRIQCKKNIIVIVG